MKPYSRDLREKIVALDEEDALERIGGGQARADLALINLVGKSPEEALEIERRIRGHAKYDGYTPLVVMAEKYGEDVEGTDVNAGGMIGSPTRKTATSYGTS